jgi:hypothetical protein
VMFLVITLYAMVAPGLHPLHRPKPFLLILPGILIYMSYKNMSRK